MLEIWLKVAQDNFVRLASDEAAVGLARLDLLDDLAAPLPHAQLHTLAPEVEIVGVEVKGFVGGRPQSSFAQPLGLAALFDGELDFGLTRDENAPKAVISFGPHHLDQSLLQPSPQRIAKSVSLP